MCRGNDHGGRRCPADTSDARRQRRKAAKIRAQLQTVEHTPNINLAPVTPGISAGMQQLQQEAVTLREEIYGDIPEGLTQEEFDLAMEEKLTTFGSKLAQEIDSLANVNLQDISDEKERIENEIYLPQYGEAIQAADEKHGELLDQLKELPESEKELIYGENSFRFRIDVQSLSHETLLALPDSTVNLLYKIEEAKKEMEAASDAFKQLDAKYDAAIEDLYANKRKAIKEATKQIIGQLRPVGGTVASKEHSDAAAVELIDNTVAKHYPTEWLERHNELAKTENIEIKETTNRALYSNTFISEHEEDGIEKPVPGTYYIAASSNLVETLTTNFSEQASIASFETEHYFNGEVMSGVFIINNTEEIYNPDIHTEEPSEETGWKYKPSLASINLVNSTMNDDEISETWTKSYWVKPVTTTKKTVRRMELNTKDINDEATAAAIAYHEFGHRMEEVLPNKMLPRQEKAFLMRRTGKNSENFRTGLQALNSSGEFAHKAGFVDNYMGRDYLHNNENFEVFTTGVESVYGGGYGGLLGLSKKYTRQDLDHRNFTLGVLGLL